MKRLRYWARCPKCQCWFGTHDHVVLHGDGRTDDTDACQLLITRGKGFPPGEFRVSNAITLPKTNA